MSNIVLYDVNGECIDSLSQWDYNISIKIGGVNIDPVPEIRCWNRKSKIANRVKAEISDGFVEFVVPNELLQEHLPIIIQLFYFYKSGDSKAEYRVVIPVKSGKMPEGYVYSPSDVRTLDSLEKRIKALESYETIVSPPSIGVWADKKFVAFGTSITNLCKNHNGGYLEVIRTRNGFNSYLNAGVSGAPMTNNTANGNGINYKIRNTDISGYALIIIECCTNDFKLNVPLGVVGHIGDDVLNINTFCGALRDSIEYILMNDPTKHILLIADPQRDNDGYDVNYTNSSGHKLVDYIDALVEIAAMYGIPVCDWYRTSGINALTLSTYTKDGLHPNVLGYMVLGNVAASVVADMYCGFSDVKLRTLESIETTYEYGFIVKGTGELETTGQLNRNWKTSAYIPVAVGEEYVYTGTVQPVEAATTGAAVWGYDSNKTPVQVIIDNGIYVDSQEFTIPSGVAFIRCCFYDNGEYPVEIAKFV